MKKIKDWLFWNGLEIIQTITFCIIIFIAISEIIVLISTIQKCP
jgi:5-bromo-4-chloroindolyl phosphate hydrolysis protein